MSRKLSPKRCPCCDKKPAAYTRWASSTPRYHWYQCDTHAPYSLFIGPCIWPSNTKRRKIHKKMVLGWNTSVAIKEEKLRKAAEHIWQTLERVSQE